MATNYYAFITPTLERKRELVDLILVEKNYEKIVQEVVKTFGFYGVDIGGEPKAPGFSLLPRWITPPVAFGSPPISTP